MDRPQSKTLAAIILIVVLVLAYSLAVFFKHYVNKGVLVLNSNHAPYEVLIDKESINCPTEICSIIHESSLVNLTIQSDGYFPNTIQSLSIPKWRQSLEHSFELQKLPSIELISSIPIAESPKLILKKDSETSKQHLVEQGIQEETIVIFPGNIAAAKIIQNSFMAVVIDTKETNKAYRVDLINKTKESISDIDLSNIDAAALSNSGKYLAYNLKGSTDIWIYKFTKGSSKIDKTTNDKVYGWVGDKLYFLEKNNGIDLAIHDPSSKTTSQLIHFDYPSDIPRETLIPTNPSSIYFAVSEQAYKIDLGTL